MNHDNGPQSSAGVLRSPGRKIRGPASTAIRSSWRTVLALVLCASPAIMAEVLVLENGSIVRGDVVETSADSITIDLAGDSAGGDRPRVRYPAKALSPRSFVDVRGKSLHDDEIEPLLELSDYAAMSGLYRHSRDLLTRIEAASADRDESFATMLQARRSALHRAEAQALLATALERKDSGDLDGALKLAKTLKVDFADTDAGAQGSRLADELIGERAETVRRQDAEAEAALAAEGDAARQRALKRARQALELAKKHADEAATATDACIGLIEQGNRSRMRKRLAAAQKGLRGAREITAQLSDLLAGQGDDERTEAGKLLADAEKIESDCGDALVRLHIRVARSYVEERNYKAAAELVQEGMEISPNDPSLRDLDEEISKNWKKRSAANRSNAGARINNRP